jgi:YVTN family beta-propeller protein
MKRLIYTLLVIAALRVTAANYEVFVSNERDGTVSIIDGATRKVSATIEVGKRPRGIHASPDGRTLYVAVSGTPIAGPPKRDASGKLIDEDDDRPSDHAQDGIAVVDIAARKLIKKLPAGTDPEQFAVSLDGKKLFIANEDAGTASVLNVASGVVEATVRVADEPEGVGLSPNGKWVYVTCEAGGEIFVIDTVANKAIANFKVGARPRSAAFLPDSSRAFVPAESAGELNVVDTAIHKVVRTKKLPEGSLPMDTAVTRDGSKLFVSTGRGGNVCVLHTKTLSLLHTIKVGARAWGIALTPDDKLVYVANGPSNDVSVIDTASAKEIAKIKAGYSPWGVAIVPSTRSETAAK